MTRKLLIIAILVLFGLLAWLLSWTPAGVDGAAGGPIHRTLDLAAPPTGGDFILDSASGPVDLAALRGDVVLIYFGYTWCPDICPTNLVLIAAALKALTPEELERVHVLFVSVDPERDSAERLAEYSGYFHPKILGLTGTPEQIAEVAKLYGAAYRRTELADSAMGYVVDHSAYSYLVDPQGRLVRNLDHATPSAEIVAAIRNLLAAQMPVRDGGPP
ncbi:SCO1/SenC-like protein, putative copper metallochaperone [Thiocapsa sp. KS1]|nr:SCO family protein [Thiocapsa sp. KS1]CRI64770.1 SCO1/SenC-like protein, putative copper metallochaperone [Thiocapsa sp. KS1]